MKILFAGPSLYGQLDSLENRQDLEVRGPASRGDIAAAVDGGATAIGLVDGCFGDLPAVWHKEILYAIERRVPIGGGASMGALRASECAPLGMIGLGTIFADYSEGRLLDDEAVAVSHAPADLGWMPVSVPWVNFEATIERASSEGTITRAEADLVMLAGKQLHFSERTFASAVSLCGCLSPDRKTAIRRELAVVTVDRKRQDAWVVVNWLSAVTAPGPVPAWQLAETSHWLALRGSL